MAKNCRGETRNLVQTSQRLAREASTERGGFLCAKSYTAKSLINKVLASNERAGKTQGMTNGQKIGYARVSTREQNLDLQLDALQAAGCDQIFTDQGISGAAIERDGLSQGFESVDQGDNSSSGS